MNINLKGGLPIFVEKLHAFSPTLHDQLFGKFASAHPKVDTINNRLVSWVYSAVEGTEGPLKTHPLMKIYEWDDTFQPVTEEISHLFPNTGIAPHDFSITENYHVFIENRASGDTIPYLLGKITQPVKISKDVSSHIFSYPLIQLNLQHTISLTQLSFFHMI